MPSQKDSTAHAAVMAIREACRYQKSPDLSDCEIHLSCEPCPLCVAAIYYAGIRKIYYAATRSDAAKIGFGTKGMLIVPPDDLELVQAREPERIAARVVFNTLLKSEE